MSTNKARAIRIAIKASRAYQFTLYLTIGVASLAYALSSIPASL